MNEIGYAASDLSILRDLGVHDMSRRAPLFILVH